MDGVLVVLLIFFGIVFAFVGFNLSPEDWLWIKTTIEFWGTKALWLIGIISILHLLAGGGEPEPKFHRIPRWDVPVDINAVDSIVDVNDHEKVITVKGKSWLVGLDEDGAVYHQKLSKDGTPLENKVRGSDYHARGGVKGRNWGAGLDLRREINKEIDDNDYS
jgi:hypothetical protein